MLRIRDRLSIPDRGRLVGQRITVERGLRSGLVLRVRGRGTYVS
jgi:hypothetical protein